MKSYKWKFLYFYLIEITNSNNIYHKIVLSENAKGFNCKNIYCYIKILKFILAFNFNFLFIKANLNIAYN